jgi:LAGLIDADG-like domain
MSRTGGDRTRTGLRRIRARSCGRGELRAIVEAQGAFDPRTAGPLYDREAGVWHPTVQRNCLYPTVEYSIEINSPSIADRRIASVLTLDSAGWRDFLIARGYEWGRLSAGKELPDFVMQGDLETARVVLRAFVHAEGTVDLKRRSIELMTASRMLGEQLRHLLRRFGILASCRPIRAAATNGANNAGDGCRLSITGESARRFLAEIGFGDPGKDQRLLRMLAGGNSNSNEDGVYTQDVVVEFTALGAPIRWLGITDSQLHTQRMARPGAVALIDAIRRVADRLDSREFASTRACGAALLKGRAATLAAIDTRQVRHLADRLERRVGEEVFHLTVESIEEVELDGWVYDFEVAEHHSFIAGGMLAHNSSIMLRGYLNAVQDSRGAVVLIDRKRSFALRALALTPWLCGKRVWYLNLSRPAFGMSPLRMAASKQAIAGVIVDALRDVFSDQILQASREMIEKCTLAALALAEAESRPPRIEDVFNLMVWENERLRARAVQACARIPDGDRVRDYFTIELAGDMRENTAHTRDRLRAPRNKLDGLLTSPPLRIYFNHPSEKPLEEIIADRDVLIVDADLGDGGSENSALMISFLLQMLDSVLTRQQGVGPEEISRVHLFIDEAGHVLNR